VLIHQKLLAIHKRKLNVLLIVKIRTLLSTGWFSYYACG